MGSNRKFRFRLSNQRGYTATHLSVFFGLFFVVLQATAIDDYHILCNGSTSMTSFTASSNNTYALVNCSNSNINSDEPFFVDLVPTNVSNGILENVTVHVVGGTVLPRISTRNFLPTLLSIRNVLVNATNISVKGKILLNETVQSDNNFAVSMLDLVLVNTLQLVENISVVVDRCLVDIVVETTTNAVVVAPFLFIGGGNDNYVDSNNISAIVVSVKLSNFSVSVNISGSASASRSWVGMMVIQFGGGTVSGVVMDLFNSTLSLQLTASMPPNRDYQYSDPTLFFIKSFAEISISNSVIKNIHFISSGMTNMSLSSFVPRNATDSASILAIGRCLVIKGMTVNLASGTTAVTNVCNANCTDYVDHFPRARIVEVSGIVSFANFVTNASNMTLIATDATFTLMSPKTALFFTWQSTAILTGISVTIDKCTTNVTSSNLNLGALTRSQAVVEMSSTNNGTMLDITVANSIISFQTESGSCLVALSNVISLLDNISFTQVYVENVEVRSASVDGTATLVQGLFATVTMTTSIVGITMQALAYINVGTELRITVANAVMNVIHATEISVAAFLALVVSIASIASIASAVRSLENSTILIENSHVRRSSFSQNGVTIPALIQSSSYSITSHYNITAIVNLFDATSTALQGDNRFVVFLPVLYNLSGGKPATIVHTNVTTTLRANCTATYESGVVPYVKDNIALIMLPSVSVHSGYFISDTHVFPTTVVGSSIVAAVGRSRLVDCTMIVERVEGWAMLLTASVDPISLEGASTSLQFSDVNVQAAFNGQGMQQYVIGANGTTVDVVIPQSKEFILGTNIAPSFLTISRCTFRGYRKLFMPGIMNITHEATTSSVLLTANKFVLGLGCNLWEDSSGGGTRAVVEVLSEGNIATTSDLLALRPFIDYPHSLFNSSIRCRGFIGTNTPSSSWTYELPQVTPAPAVPPVVVSTVTSITGIIGAAASSGLMDAQSLVALGRSVCAPQALHEATSASQFLLSPFYSLGDYAMVFGNLGLFLLFHGVHRLLLQRATVRPKPQTLFTKQNDIMSNRGVDRNPAAAVKFPNQSIAAAMLLLPGVVGGGVRALFSGGNVLDTVAGVTALIVTILSVLWRVRGGRSPEVRRMRFVLWPRRLRNSFAISSWLVPYGQWGPLTLRSTHGRMRSSVRGGAEWLSEQTITATLLVQAVTSIPVPTSWCVGLWFVLCGIQLVSVALMIVVRPARAPATNVVQTASLFATAALEMVAGLTSSSAITSVGAEAPLSALSLLLMLLSIVKAAHVTFVLLWETRHNSTTNSVAATTMSTMSVSSAQLSQPAERRISTSLRSEKFSSISPKAFRHPTDTTDDSAFVIRRRAATDHPNTTIFELVTMICEQVKREK